MHAVTVKHESFLAVRVVLALSRDIGHTPGHTALDRDALGADFRRKRRKVSGSRVARALVFASCGPLSTRSGALAVARREPGVIAVMNLRPRGSVCEGGPAVPGDPVAFVGPLEGEFHGGAAVPFADAVVETGLNRQEAQSPEAVTLESEMRRAEQVEIIRCP